MEDSEKLQVAGTVENVAVINEVAGETPDQVMLDGETLPPEALPPVDVEQDMTPDESIETAAMPEQDESGDGIGDADTKSVSSTALTFRSALCALVEELRNGPMAETFAMEIDEIDLFLGRTMHSVVQKLD